MSPQGALVTWALIIFSQADEPHRRGGFRTAQKASLQPLRRRALHLQEPSGPCRRRPWLPLGQVKQSRCGRTERISFITLLLFSALRTFAYSSFASSASILAVSTAFSASAKSVSSPICLHA
eukprot:CCRYP_020297-RA/>CCRYP_020297-RA protein AED:0.26 eAED:0.26 QI:168/1/1/1/0/0/2/19/121